MLLFLTFRYGLPVNFQAMLLCPQKKSIKRLREVLNQLYSHLDNSAYTGGGSSDVSINI
jgi:V-type H+-transporting ATPase subunit C